MIDKLKCTAAYAAVKDWLDWIWAQFVQVSESYLETFDHLDGVYERRT